MKFGVAIGTAREGAKVCRSGWNGKNMFLFYVHDWTFHGEAISNGTFDKLPFLAMKTADDKVVPWLASQTDILADDWEVVP